MDRLVEIDVKSGFCFGVKEAIRKAEEALSEGKNLYCLGDIVHNDEEVSRLEELGMKTIQKEEYFQLTDAIVLVRAHGEPPEVYNYADNHNIALIEGTCPVVLKLQDKIRAVYQQNPNNQIVIFGKPSHPEVVGLVGQTENSALVINSPEDCKKVSLNTQVSLFSQTTMSKGAFKLVKDEISALMTGEGQLNSIDSICGQIANRGPWLEKFALRYDAILFVGGKKSSNSKVLFGHCQKVNINSFFVSSVEEVNAIDLAGHKKIGICGATSTPMWLMENVAEYVQTL